MSFLLLRKKTTLFWFQFSSMLKWVAQLLESQGDMQGALQYYTKAQDACSIVRVLCFINDFSRAEDIVNSTNDRAAAYHLARQFEAMGKLDEALIFFSKAHAFGNAIRICKVPAFKKKSQAFLKYSNLGTRNR